MMRFLTMRRLTTLFLVLFAVSVAGMLTYQYFWLNPEQRCERGGRWYEPESRRCLTPIYIPNITKRPAGVTRAEASAEANRELVAAEQEARRVQAEMAAAAETQRRNDVEAARKALGGE